jgi:hypothetical protein
VSAKKYVVALTLKEATSYGIVVCTCGHPRNNHFDHDDKPCAHCKCRTYKQTFRAGQAIKVENDK